MSLSLSPKQHILSLLHGHSSPTAPFWEVWFKKQKMQEKLYGDPANIESTIAMAHDLGMAALSVGYLDTNCHFGENHTTDDGDSRYAGGVLTSLSQLEERPLPTWDTVIPVIKEKVEKLLKADIASVLYLPWCFHTIATGMGLENFSYKLYDEPEFIKTCMRWVEERNRLAIDEVVSKVRPDIVLFDGDCAYKNGLMVQPDVFRDLVFEETKKTVSKLKDLNIPYTFHTDGKLDDVLPILIELGFSAVHGCEKQANDLAFLVEKFGDDICLVGNMDVVFLTNATQQQVKEQTQEMLNTGLKKQKFIAACNTSPQDYIPDENYIAMCRTIQNQKN